METPFRVDVNAEKKSVRITCLTKDSLWHKIRVTLNKKWYDEPLLYFNFEFPDIYHYHEVFGIDTHDVGFLLFQSLEDDDTYYKHHLVNYKKMESDAPEFNPCILVSSFPNTLEKEVFLVKHLRSLKKSGLPVFLCSNMLIKEEIIKNADHFIYTGPNQMYSILDFYDLKSALKKVVHDFKPMKVLETGNDERVIFHDMNHQIYSKKNYYWSAINSSKRAFQTLAAWGYTHVMKTEGEFLLNEKDKDLPKAKLKEMSDNNIQGDYFIRWENFHIEAFVYFADVRFLSKVYSSFSAKDFFSSGTTPENFVKYRIFFSEAYNKIRVSVFKKYENFIRRRSWVTENVDVVGITDDIGSIETLLPNTAEIRYSHNTEVAYKVPAIENLEIEVLPTDRTMKVWKITARNFAAGAEPETIVSKVTFLDKDKNKVEEVPLVLNARQYVIIERRGDESECFYVEYTAEYASEKSNLEKNRTTRIFDYTDFFETKQEKTI